MFGTHLTAVGTLGRIVLSTVALWMAACQSEPAAPHSPAVEASSPALGYLEVVTTDVEGTVALQERMHGLSFGPKDAAMGNARIAEMRGGTLMGVREPLAAHETSVVRAYVAVDDIEKATAAAGAAGATIAYPPTKQAGYGTFAIVIKDGVEHGLWQR
ncbi:MAG: VOC family protein [Nannocystaceae bacterium]|nr:hypothetical protein [bacterium]